MSILSRFRDVMASNVNAWLERSSDPENTIDEYMRGARADVGRVKAEAAALLTGEQRTKRELDECLDEIRKLQRYAEKSAASGDDARARAFLERKEPLAAQAVRLRAAYGQAAANAGKLRQMEEKLTDDLARLEARRAELKGKIAATREQAHLNTASGGGASAGSGGRDAAFRAAEDKINAAYHEAMALAELRGQPTDDFDELFAQFERSERAKQAGGDPVGDELAAMKARLQQP